MVVDTTTGKTTRARATTTVATTTTTTSTVAVATETVAEPILRRNPHLRTYLTQFSKETGTTPTFSEHLTHDMALLQTPNIIYPVGDPIFIHIYQLPRLGRRYVVIEPQLAPEELQKKDEILREILARAPYEPVHETRAEFESIFNKLLKSVTYIVESSEGEGSSSSKSSWFQRLWSKRIPLTEDAFKRIAYRIRRDVMEHGIIEALVRDPYIEDIHVVGTHEIAVVHKVFGMIRTNIRFQDKFELDRYLRQLSERIGKPVSDARPIVDASLPDGSRINIVYSDDVSREGPSFTIRKFAEKPPTMPQLVKWGTFSSQMAAYLWLALEYGMSIFMSGETASGKTTTLNSLLSFISFDKKIYSAEDTPEVVAPQPVWQRLITRETGPEEARVELFDLVKTALRSRPDYIIVGEVRGREGSAAFQAIQTGHAVLSTFHASSIQKMIQRFVGDPINIPIRFMDNLNIALFQQIVYERGRIIRRCSSIQEIIRYSKEKGGVLTREVFQWDPITDTHHFRGMYNSYILENKIAPQMGLENPVDIYKELEYRSKIIQKIVDKNVLDYDRVNAIFRAYSEHGYQGIPVEFRPS